MHVAVVIKTNEGGMWTLPQIDELRERDHHVTVVLPPGPGRLRRALDARGVPVVESEFPFSFRPQPATLVGLLRLRRQLAALAPDVVFHHLYASALAVRLATAGLRIPAVHMVAGPLPLEAPVVRAVERLLARCDTTTICGSEHTARLYRALGRAPDVTPAIPLGVDTTRFSPVDPAEAHAERAALGIDAEAFVVVMVAFFYAPKRLVHCGRGIKGHDVLLDAWADFRRRHPESRLVLVGGGFDEAGERYRRDLMVRHRQLTAASAVTWIATTDDVRKYYALADLSVSPSLSENHGAVLEASAMGVPSIVSDAGALPETVLPETGWVVPRGEVQALLTALESAHREHRAGVLARRGLRAREYVHEAFNCRRSSSAVAEVLERAERQDRRRPRVYSLFCEARLGRGPDGSWATEYSGTWDRYLRQGGRLTVVARADDKRRRGTLPLPPGVDVRPLPNYVGVRRLAAVALPLALEVGRAVRDADRVVLRLPGIIGSLGAAACLMMRRRYAVEVVGDPREVLAAGVLGTVGRWAAAAAAAVTRWIVWRADAALYTTADRLQRRYPARRGSVTAGMANVVLTADAFAEEPRRWRPGHQRIVAIGSQEQHYKGHDVLLRAVRRLVDDGRDVDAVIVGGGRRHGELRALAGRLGLSDRVSLTGTITDRRRLVEILDGATIFAMPSRTEGMPRALLEAMARGLPAVGTTVGGIPELLDPTCLVNPDDDRALALALADLLDSSERWEEQSRRNLEVARNYRLENLQQLFDHWLQSVPESLEYPVSDAATRVG